MRAGMWYNSTVKSITQEISLNLLSGRSKVNLLQSLMEDLGITKIIAQDQPKFSEFIKVLDEQNKIAWNQEAPILTIKPKMY